MHPMYGWPEFYPRPVNQTIYMPYPTQSLERIPPYIKMEPTRSTMFDHWPHSGSYGSLHPSDCHGCCNHNYFPGHYGFRPPYPHFPPPHYQRSYPPFFGGYPEYQYQIPPPHYSMEHPRYEYDKGFPRDQHCCKYPNHSCKRESDETAKTEERGMDIDKKSSGSFVPSHMGNYPFPLVMIPPGYLMDSDGSKSAKSEGKEDKKINHETDSDKSSKSLNSSGSLHEKETKSQQDIHGQFPFPLFWLPYKSREAKEDDLKGTNSGQEAVFPPFQENNDEEKIPTSATGRKMIGNGATEKTTPAMKTMESVEEKKKDEERKVKAIPVVQADDKEERGRAGNSAKNQTSSLKSSKLPPVCLRVDPPSKSKKVNGSSRSPSPPADGRRSRQLPTANSGSLNQNEQSHSQVEKINTKVVEGTEESKRLVSPSHEEVSSRKSTVEGANDVVNQDVGKATKKEEASMEGQLVNKEDAAKIRRKKLTDSEAATTIQAVYRGYVVRKSEPLKKLRQITEVIQKMSEVKSHISDLDASCDAKIDEKQLVAIGETIMSLLLKLDTIQGLHSNVREIRKSVAKELVSLQEKLDSLTARKAQALIVPPSSETPEGPTAIMTDNVGVESDQNEAEVVPDGAQVEPEGFENSDFLAVEDSGDNTSELPAISCVVLQIPESDQERKLEEDQKDQVINDGEGQMSTENEESAGETLIFHADTQNEPEDSSSPVELSGRVDEVDEQIIMSNRVLETTELAGGLSPTDEHALNELEVGAGTENMTPVIDKLGYPDGNQEENKNIVQESYPGPEEKRDEQALDKDVSQTESHEEAATDKVDPKEDQQVQTETELTTPVQETEANVNSEDLKVADTTPEWVPPVTEDRVHDIETKESSDTADIDGGNKNVPVLSGKEIPMQDDIVNQVTVGQSESAAAKTGMEKGGEVVMEENRRLKEMMEKLIEAGNKQLATITKLSGKVKDLEKELSKKKKLKKKKITKGKRQDMVLV